MYVIDTVTALARVPWVIAAPVLWYAAVSGNTALLLLVSTVRLRWASVPLAGMV